MAGEGWNNQLVSLIIITAGTGFTGLFMYSPVPGTGNLVTSIAPAAGVDPFGNPYPAGVTVGKYPGVQANLGVTPSGVGIMQFLLNSGLFSNPEIVGAITGSPNFADLGLIGPSNTNPSFDDSISVGLNSSDGVSSSANLSTFYNSVAGPVFTYFTIDASGVGIRAASQVTATQPGTGTPATPAQSEVWHDLRPLTGSFVGTIAGRYPPQYRKCADGDIEVVGCVQFPGTGGPNFNNITFANLPAGWRPLSNSGFRGLTTFETNVTPIGTQNIQVDSSGNIQFHNCPVSGMAGVVAHMYLRFPLDNTGTILS
jgi:hypothetical protein